MPLDSAPPRGREGSIRGHTLGIVGLLDEVELNVLEIDLDEDADGAVVRERQRRRRNDAAGGCRGGGAMLAAAGVAGRWLVRLCLLLKPAARSEQSEPLEQVDAFAVDLYARHSAPATVRRVWGVNCLGVNPQAVHLCVAAGRIEVGKHAKELVQ